MPNLKQEIGLACAATIGTPRREDGGDRPGAPDNGAEVAAMLRTVRALRARDKVKRNVRDPEGPSRPAVQVADARWQDHDLVFASTVDTELDSHNVRRAFRKVLKKAGLSEKEWTPREMRHSFVSLLSAVVSPSRTSRAWSATATRR
jgi:hypothetical protein